MIYFERSNRTIAYSSNKIRVCKQGKFFLPKGYSIKKVGCEFLDCEDIGEDSCYFCNTHRWETNYSVGILPLIGEEK